MTRSMVDRVFTVKTLVRAAFMALSISSIGVAHPAQPFQPPSQNYQQNNWMAGGGG